jgi:hypothetical protein
MRAQCVRAASKRRRHVIRAPNETSGGEVAGRRCDRSSPRTVQHRDERPPRVAVERRTPARSWPTKTSRSGRQGFAAQAPRCRVPVRLPDDRARLRGPAVMERCGQTHTPILVSRAHSASVERLGGKTLAPPQTLSDKQPSSGPLLRLRHRLQKGAGQPAPPQAFQGIPTNVVTLWPVSVSDTREFATVMPEPCARLLFAEVSQGVSVHGGEPET